MRQNTITSGNGFGIGLVKRNTKRNHTIRKSPRLRKKNMRPIDVLKTSTKTRKKQDLKTVGLAEAALSGSSGTVTRNIVNGSVSVSNMRNMTDWDLGITKEKIYLTLGCGINNAY